MNNQQYTENTFTDNLREKRSDNFEDLRNEFREVRLSKAIPVISWLKDKPWNLVWVRWLLLYALFPFIASNLLRSGVIELKDVAWAFGTYFALAWLVVLSFFMLHEKINVGLLAKVALFTAFVGISSSRSVRLEV